MVDNKYAVAYSEVLEILKHIPIEDYNKIPKNKIELFETYANNDHTFNYDTSKTLEEQNVSDITKGIIILLFRDYWATQIQRNKIIAKQNYDRIKLEEKKKEKYNPNDIFKNKNTSTNDNKINQDVQEQLNEEYNKNLPMEVQKQNIFQRLISFIKKLIHK